MSGNAKRRRMRTDDPVKTIMLFPLGGAIHKTPDGWMDPQDLEGEARRMNRRAARLQRGVYWTRFRNARTWAVDFALCCRFGRGGTMTFSPETAGTRLGADFIMALERIGAGAKVRIGEVQHA